MIFDFATIDKSNRGNLYNSIYESIKQAVLCGAIKKGEKLPSIRETASQLGVSRTTVENAYTRLCIEGIAESSAQKGFFIIGKGKNLKPQNPKDRIYNNDILYDFSSRKIDEFSADTENWKKLIRNVLRDSEVLTSYGDPQGEYELREALASYSYKARGVIADSHNIIIGAGIGPLLNILCGIIDKKSTIAIEGGNFKAAQNIFSDYGIKCIAPKTDSQGIVINDVGDNADLLFLMPSVLSKISVNGLAKRRSEISDWVKKSENRMIIEDDYNGELRYTARAVPAFQNNIPEKCVYIGSFSKLLLPSVRIAYMVLPKNIMENLREKMKYYNQTCGKTEQLALTEYINSGGLEKHLKRLRRLYYQKSQVLCRELEKRLSSLKSIILYETSLTVEVFTYLNASSEKICHLAELEGIRLMSSVNDGSFKLCFAGISQEDIPLAVESLNKVLEKI